MQEIVKQRTDLEHLKERPYLIDECLATSKIDLTSIHSIVVFLTHFDRVGTALQCKPHTIHQISRNRKMRRATQLTVSMRGSVGMRGRGDRIDGTVTTKTPCSSQELHRPTKSQIYIAVRAACATCAGEWMNGELRIADTRRGFSSCESVARVHLDEVLSVKQNSH
jgi:hypothetical protein